MITTHAELFEHPDQCAQRILRQRRIYGLTSMTVLGNDASMVILELKLSPLVPMARDNYPDEVVTLIVLADQRVFALPTAGARSWRHRMPEGLRELCLWYVRDHPELQWSWDDGLEVLITIVHRHVMAEEYFRRNRRWPIDEAPHGLSPHREVPASTGRHALEPPSRR